MIIELDHQIIPDLPYTWKDALTQGNSGVVATPSENQIENIIQLARDLIPVVKLCGAFHINSWLRTPQHNASVGGALHSAHLLGAAVDLHPLDKSVADCKAIWKTVSNRNLFFEINTSVWWHLDFIHDHDFIA